MSHVSGRVEWDVMLPHVFRQLAQYKLEPVHTDLERLRFLGLSRDKVLKPTHQHGDISHPCTYLILLVESISSFLHIFEDDIVEKALQELKVLSFRANKFANKQERSA